MKLYQNRLKQSVKTLCRCSTSAMSTRYHSVNPSTMKTPGQRRDDKIFDETAVVGVQEFASSLCNQGLVPNFASVGQILTAGSQKYLPDQRDAAVDNDLDEVTDYVFEVLAELKFQHRRYTNPLWIWLLVLVYWFAKKREIQLIPLTSPPFRLPHVVLDTGP